MALSRHHATSRPLNVQEVVTQAEDFEFSTKRPLQPWLRSAKMLLTEAAICEQDGDVQMAYLYLYRHAELVLSRLPQHPEYKDAAHKHELHKARRAVQESLVKLEQLKPMIEREYQRYSQAVEQRKADRRRSESERHSTQSAASDRESPMPQSQNRHNTIYGDVTQAISAVENNQLAVDLARQELKRRDFTRLAAKNNGFAKPNSPPQIAHGLQSGFDRVHESVKEAGRHLHHHGSRDSGSSGRAATTTFQYPSVPAKGTPIVWPEAVPARPSKEPRDARPEELLKDLSIDVQGPARPPKTMAPVSQTPPSMASPSPPPLVRPSMPASRYTFEISAFTEAGKPLRTLLLPPELRTEFLNIAYANTLQNKETCGILCGTLISNALFINHLIIPDQNSTSDTCDTTEEGDNALFDYCDGHDLLVCGWIHTHPTQSCFLSSRDLHTSSGYQIMLPEAIAIVCAPSQSPDWGIFRLTDPPGLSHVLDCHKPGLFHPHSERNLYTDASRPGHVVEGPGLKFDVVDLRKR